MSEVYNFWSKHQTQLFLNTAAASAESPSWARLGLSTVLDVALNAQTEDYDFIKDKNPTTVVDRYLPSIAEECMAKEGDSCFDYLWKLFYSLPTGSECETDCLVVWPKSGTTSGSFDSWKFLATLVLNDFDAVAKKISFEIRAAGDVSKGTVTVTSGVPTFVAAAE